MRRSPSPSGSRWRMISPELEEDSGREKSEEDVSVTQEVLEEKRYSTHW